MFSEHHGDTGGGYIAVALSMLAQEHRDPTGIPANDIGVFIASRPEAFRHPRIAPASISGRLDAASTMKTRQ